MGDHEDRVSYQVVDRMQRVTKTRQRKYEERMKIGVNRSQIQNEANTSAIICKINQFSQSIGAMVI